MTSRDGAIILLPRIFGGTVDRVVARGIVNCAHNVYSGTSVSIDGGGLGSTAFIEHSRKCRNHAAHDSVGLLLTNATAKELRHPAK